MSPAVCPVQRCQTRNADILQGSPNLLEETVEVNVDDIAGSSVKQNVLRMAVTESWKTLSVPSGDFAFGHSPKDEPDHGHDCSGPAVCHPTG